MHKELSRTGFSLIELLLALSILAIVAATIAPQYLGIQKQAYSVIAGAYTSKTLNDTLAEWQAAGGTVGSNASAGSILYTLSASSPVLPGTHSDPTVDVSDGGYSPTIRLPLPPGDLSPALSSSTNSTVVRAGKTLMIWDWSRKVFACCSTDDIGMPANTQLRGDVSENNYTPGQLGILVWDVNNNAYPHGYTFAIKE
jgi:prepilin-type N-terminal cleavage/methylation domain-containing protein